MHLSEGLRFVRSNSLVKLDPGRCTAEKPKLLLAFLQRWGKVGAVWGLGPVRTGSPAFPDTSVRAIARTGRQVRPESSPARGAGTGTSSRQAANCPCITADCRIFLTCPRTIGRQARIAGSIKSSLVDFGRSRGGSNMPVADTCKVESDIFPVPGLEKCRKIPTNFSGKDRTELKS
jgi:hypothetical protein